MSWGSKFNATWVGRGRGRLRLVQNDRTDCRNVLGWFLVKNSMKKTMNIYDFPCFSVNFPRFSRITRVSDNQGFRSLRYGDEPFVALLETSTFGSPGGGKESVYRLYLLTTVWYFAII